jgi:hypothetical protein
MNPLGAKVPQGTVLAGAELSRFRAEKARIDGLLKSRAQPTAVAENTAGQPLRR